MRSGCNVLYIYKMCLSLALSQVLSQKGPCLGLMKTNFKVVMKYRTEILISEGTQQEEFYLYLTLFWVFFNQVLICDPTTSPYSFLCPDSSSQEYYSLLFCLTVVIVLVILKYTKRLQRNLIWDVVKFRCQKVFYNIPWSKTAPSFFHEV